MAKIYYTKCGRKFNKSSTSVVTRYEELDNECKSCPYVEHGSTYRGNKEVPITYCQAGEKEPNKKTDCNSTGMNDSTNLHIKTLNMVFIKDIEIYIKDIPGVVSYYFNSLDSGDCRKNYVISFDKNKKGIAAKNSIVAKYFSNGKGFEYYIPEDKAVKKLQDEMKYQAKCPYLSVIGDKYIQCCLHAINKGRPEFPSGVALDEHINNVCYCDFDKCEIYQASYKEEIETQDKYLLEYRKCAFCCNNSQHTGLKEHDGSTHGFCQLWQEDKELFNTNTVCEWFNRKYRQQDSFINNKNLSLIGCGDTEKEVLEVFFEDKKGSLDTYEEQKEILNNHLQYIRNKCRDIIGNYIEIGFTLLNIKNNKLFKARGYNTLIDCVEAELNMKKSTAYNLIKIAEKFGDQETKQLKTEYSQYNYVQCIEMSSMSPEELSQAKPEMTKTEMKQLKNSNRLEKAQEKKDEPLQVLNEQINTINNENIYEVTDYSIIEQDKKKIPENIESTPPEGVDVRYHKPEEIINNIIPFHSKDVPGVDPDENDLIKDSQHENIDINTVTPESVQSNINDNDILINNLLIENDEYKQKIKTLERDKIVFKDLLNQIDKDFDKLSKKQIRNALWDYCNTGTILFDQN